MKCQPTNQRMSASGFTLVEVVVALGLFVFAITVLMAVIPSGMQQVQTTSNESLAITTMEAIRDDIDLTLDSKTAKSLRYEITPPSVGNTAPMNLDFMIAENGEIASGSAVALLRIKGTLRRPATAADGPIHLHLRATWPAKAPVGRETGNIELVAAFKP
jgi:type II secretory pathway pseudopilin PulG